MPNYVAHIVTLVGSDEQVQKAVEFVKGDYGVFDFDKIVPMPETFRKYDTTNHDNARQMRVGEPLGWNGPIVTEEMIEEYKQATKEQMEEYGVVGWYDWSRIYWGTKWNACDAEYHGDGLFTFDTAWSAALPVLKALSKQFPDIRVEFVYADEDYGYNTGQGSVEGGEMEIYCPNGGSDEAYELYFQTHEWARDEMHKNEKGKWVWNED